MNNINYHIEAHLPAMQSPRKLTILTRQYDTRFDFGMENRKVKTKVFSELGGKVKLALGIIYFFSLMYFTLMLIA